MANTRKKIGHVLRKLRLISLADRFLFYWENCKKQRKNDRFLAEHPGFIPPPKHLAFDAYNHIDYEIYQRSGERNARLISSIIERYIASEKIHILEWGCGPIRVLRHLASFDEHVAAHFYGSDYNEETIVWCKQNYKHIDFSLNNLSPPLVFESNMFDCIYAFSVFTHLSERMHYEWLSEIKRVLKPDGLFVFTTHGDLYKLDLFGKEREIYESGQIVVRDKAMEGAKSFGAYHPEKFIRQLLFEDFEVLEHIAGCNDLRQDVWVAKKNR